jgi:hypothetical protein
MEQDFRAFYPGERVIVLAEQRREWRAGFGALLLVCGTAFASWMVLSAPQDVSSLAGQLVPAADAATLFADQPPLQVHTGVASAADAAVALPSGDIVKLQTKLKALGFDPGKPDGVAGPRTLKALNAYRKSLGLKPSANIDRQAAAPLMP